MLVVFSVLFVISCTNPADSETNEADSTYKVYTNFGTTFARGAAPSEGEAIIGVLLKYTSEGAYNSEVYPRDANTFSIYCLFGEVGTNGDGMEYNYVLYVPEDIKNQYAAGSGEYPDSGNPFWWFMKTYLNTSMTVIQNNWVAAIDLLCNRSECPKASSIDVPGWNTSGEFNTTYTTWEINDGSNCVISNVKAFRNSSNAMEFVISYDYTITDTRTPSVFDPPNGDVFLITGSNVTSGSGTIAFKIPVASIANQQVITTNLWSSDTDRYFTGIRLTGTVSSVPTGVVPVTAIIVENAS